ncbi:MAG TPA: hypothetical protein PL010_09085, partial [Flavobacteriales bacterium]|nr:hypothetical protein [Flavobacteriales bacterium]
MEYILKLLYFRIGSRSSSDRSTMIRCSDQEQAVNRSRRGLQVREPATGRGPADAVRAASCTEAGWTSELAHQKCERGEGDEQREGQQVA